MWLIQPLGLIGVLLCMLIVTSAGLIRGYTGFGFSLVAVPLLAMVVEPIVAVPLVLSLNVVGGIQFLPSIWRLAEVQSVKWLVIGAMVATPLGIYGLTVIPGDLLRLGIGVGVLIATLCIAAGLRFRVALSRLSTIAIGALSGLLNGGGAISGPPIILFYLGSKAQPHIGRASITLYLFFADIIAFSSAALAGLIAKSTVLLMIFLIPTSIIGQIVGARLFHSSFRARYHHITVTLLFLVAVISIAQASWTLFLQRLH